MADKCLNLNDVIKTPEYQEFRKFYPGYTDGFLVDALTAYREKYRRDAAEEAAYYPHTPPQRSAFTTYITRRYLQEARQNQSAEMTEKELVDTYTAMSRAFTPRIRRFRVNMIAQDVLDKIRDVLRSDPTLTVRQAMNKAGGYKAIVTSVFRDYQESTDPQWWIDTTSDGSIEEGTKEWENEMEQARRRADEFKLIIENRNRLAAMVAPVLSDILGIRIPASGHIMEINLDEDVVRPIADDPGQSVSPSGEVDSENEEAKGDRYVDFRIQKVEQTLTESVKLFLSGIPLLDQNGEQQYDDLGYPLYMTYQQAAFALKEEFETTDADDFMTTLESLSDKYPWVQSLYEELRASKPMQAVFFTAFKAYESIYKAVYARKGQYITDNMNARSNKRSLMQEAGANGIAGRVLQSAYSVYDQGGYLSITKSRADEIKNELSSKLGLARLVRTSAKSSNWSDSYINKRKEDYPWIAETGRKSMDLFLAADGVEEWLDKIVRAARGIGMNITKDNLKVMARKSIAKKSARFLSGNNRLVAFVDALSAFYTMAADAHSKGQDMNYLYSVASDELKVMTDAMAPAMKKETDRRAQVGETSYATWNVGGFMRQICAKLFNKGGMSRSYEEEGEVNDEGEYSKRTIEGEYEKWLHDNFFIFDNFVLDATGQPIGWLREMRDDRSFAKNKKFELQTQLEFMGVPYDALSDDQRRIAPFVMWYNEGKGKKSGTYAVMIQADYTNAWDYIKAPVYDVTIPVNKRLARTILGADASDEEIEEKLKELSDQYGDEIKELSAKFERPDGSEIEVFADIVDRFADEVRLEYERIVKIERRESLPHAKLKNHEKNGKKFLIFPAFNRTDFRKTYESKSESDETGAEATKYLKEQVVAQMEAFFDTDMTEFTSGDVAYSPYLPKTKSDEMFVSRDGHRVFSDWGYDLFRSFSLNDYYARIQMANIFFGGTSFFKSIPDMEKRSMLLHGPRSAMYTPAGKKEERVAYIRDEKTASAFMSEIKEIAEAARKRGLISEELKNRLINSYEKKIKSTDGQGFRTLESHRQFRKMNPTSQWTSAHEEAYQRIVNGKIEDGDLDLVLDDMLDDAYNPVQKAFASGWEVVDNGDGTKTRVPMIHKYSEAVILPPTILGNNFAMQSAPIKAFNRLNELLDDDEKIDLFLFESNVKIEPFSVLDPMVVENGERKFKSPEEMAQHMLAEIRRDPTFIHTIPYSFVGIAASLVPHAEDTQIAFSSQAEKQAKANITDSDEIKVPGHTMDGKHARDKYDQIEEAIMIDAWQKVTGELRDPKQIQQVLQRSLAEASYNSADMASALTPVRDGKGNSRFAVPLFSASLEHKVAELLNSIVKNRVTKVRTKGANIVQVSGVGFDQQSIPFADEGFIKDERDRLGIEFEYANKAERKGVKRIKWIDCYIAINDSRLEAYADPDGSIPPAKLRKLVKDGVIDERTLQFVAYRTPSDAEHSILPLKIKGFLPKSSGANIIIAKEAMTMTGHDYDGDKLRCHFQEFRTTLDIDRLRRDFRRNPTWRDAGALEVLFGEKLKGVASDNLIEEDDFIERVKHLPKKNQFKSKYVSTHLIEYDFRDKDEEGNKVTPFTGKNKDDKARANALIQILFGALTSESGSMRILIPGGAAEHEKIAKTFYITKSIVKEGVLDLLKKHGLREDATRKNVIDIYNFVKGLDSDTREEILDEMGSLESPFSYAHQVRSYRNMMTGTQMTGIYAMYSSTAALLQSLNLHYVPKSRQKGAVRPKIMGRWADKLFDLKYGDQGLQLLIYAELVNAAVDNGKEPILGFLNQTPELASLTFMLYAMGLGAEEIHLFLNQPAVVELQRRLTSQDSRGLGIELNALIEENKEKVIQPSKDGKPAFYSRRRAIKELAAYKKNQYIAFLPASFSAIKDTNAMKFQLSILCTLDELRGAAEQLTELVHIIRPEARNNGVGPSNAKTLTRLQKLEDMRQLIFGDITSIPERLMDTESEEDEEDDDDVDETQKSEEEEAPAEDKQRNPAIRIAGMENVFAKREIYEGMPSEQIFEEIERGAENGGQLRQAVTLHELLMRWTADYMSNYFPMMKPGWRDRIVSLAGEYDYKSIQEGTIENIAEDMILFALLDSSRYRKNLEDKREDLVINLPLRLKALKQRIEDAKKDDDSTDATAKSLADNIFLAKLDVRNPESTTDTPRIFFDAGGPVIGDMAEDIRQDWSELLGSSDKEIRKIAIDLFEYNMFTSGFGFGRYEFAHLAPLDVIIGTPGYVDALYSVMNYEFDDARWDNFRHQYYMNHWGERRLVPQVDANMLDASAMKALKRDGAISSSDKAMSANDLRGILYIAVKEKDDTYTLYRNITEKDSAEVIFEKAQKLGVRNSHGQVSVQYDPLNNYRNIEPIQVGNDSNWGDANAIARNAPGYWKKYNKKRKALADSVEKGAGEAVENTADRMAKLRALGRSIMNLGAEKADVERKNAAAEEAVAKTDEEFAKKEKAPTEVNGANETVTFLQDSSEKYPERTKKNAAAADATIAFALDFNTLGEGLTKKAVIGAKKKYIPINITSLDNINTVIDSIVSALNSVGAKSLNIAGNGIYTLKGKYTQEQIDEYIYNVLNGVVNHPDLKNEIESIRSGGQTGIDEAGAKAGIRLGIKTTILAPKGWLYRDINKQDIYDEKSFKARFDSVINSAKSSPVANEGRSLTAAEVKAMGRPMPGALKKARMPYIVRADGSVKQVPGTPNNIREARRQKAYVLLDHRLREIMSGLGYSVGVITSAEARAGLGGVADFDKARVVAEEIIEAIRVANGYVGQQALPEEVSHLSLELLGHDHPLVRRLLDVLRSSPEAVREAFEGQYDEYMEYYDMNPDMVLLEAAGKLVAKQMLRQQRIESSRAYRLVARVVDAIRNLLRKLPIRAFRKAIYDADDAANLLAGGILNGRLANDMSRSNISVMGQMANKKGEDVRKDISKNDDIVSKIIKHEMKRLALLKARLGYKADDDPTVANIEAEIKELRKSIKNHKTQSAVFTFINSSLAFLTELEGDLNNSVNNDLGDGAICHQLSICIDTLHGFARVMEDIKSAIHDGEITPTEKMEEQLDVVEKGISKFFDKCNALGLDKFEDFLSKMYGPEGLTQTVGREKGRNFSIHEIATKGDHDISIFSRWIHSASDCNDLVIKAVVERVRRAKWEAREKTLEIKHEVDVAFAKLVEATSSRDQTFMFKYKTVNGKRVKTGRYISKKDAKQLPDAQREFYNTIMAIKEKADKLLPESKVAPLKIVMLRKLALEKAHDSSTLGEKGKYIWESIRDKYLDMSDDALKDTYEVKVDFEGSRVDRLPILYTAKSKNESYDDMTDDVATSIMAYAGMANEYSELDAIMPMIENAKRVSSRREIGQRTGSRRQQETIYDETEIFHKPFTIKQAKTKIQGALDDYLAMHFYGHVQKNEGTFPGTRVSKRGVVNAANNLASLSQMALNLPQRISNITVGQAQIIIESAAKGMFQAKDVAWGAAQYAKYSGDRIMDTGQIDTDNKLSLFIEKFDISQDNRRSFKQDKYGKSRATKVVNGHLLYLGLTVGEDYLSSVSGLALAHRFKVKVKDKETGREETMNLFEAYDVKYTDPVNKTGAYLKLKDGAVKEDGTPITKEDEYRFMKSVAGLNFDMQGIYNLDDRSAAQQYAAGALIIMYRKWIAPALKRRYAGAHYDTLREQWEEGYWMTSFNYIYDTFKSIKEDGEAIKSSILLNWEKLTDYEKSNIWKAVTEMSILVATTITAATAWMLGSHGPDEDDEPMSWLEKQFVYQALRLRNELGSMAPTPMLVQEAGKILKSPFAAARPIDAALDGLNLLIPTNYFTTVKSGKYKGHTKAYKYFRNLPIISMFNHAGKFIDPDASIRYYQNPTF